MGKLLTNQTFYFLWKTAFSFHTFSTRALIQGERADLSINFILLTLHTKRVYLIPFQTHFHFKLQTFKVLILYVFYCPWNCECSERGVQQLRTHTRELYMEGELCAYSSYTWGCGTPGNAGLKNGNKILKWHHFVKQRIQWVGKRLVIWFDDQNSFVLPTWMKWHESILRRCGCTVFLEMKFFKPPTTHPVDPEPALFFSGIISARTWANCVIMWTMIR